MNIHFIGFGNLAKALAQGLCDQGDNYQITASSPSLKEGQTTEGVTTSPDNLTGLAQADLVILAVKPAQMAAVLAQIKTAVPKNCLLISVAAGLSLDWLEQHCAEGQAIVRSMPNIAATVKKGATPLIANRHVSEEQKDAAEALFRTSGIIAWTKNEDDINAFNALSGSGPAYVFFFLEALIEAAKQLGLTEDLAKQFSLQTVEGALAMARDSEHTIEELRKKVTSPAGTTAAAIAILKQQGFSELLFKAMDAAHARAKQLERE